MAAEPGAQLVGGRVLQFVEYAQGLFPGVAGIGRVSARVVSVAEVSQHFGADVRVASLPVEVDGLPEAGDGLYVIAEVVEGVSEAVQGLGLAG